MDKKYPVLAAQVAGAHGVGGNVRLRLVGRTRRRRALPPVLPDRSVGRAGGQAERDLTLSSLRRQTQPKGAWLAHFKEVKDRTGAEALVGWSVFIPEAGRAPLPDGEYYVDQLVGLDVVTDTGKPLGKLTDVIYSPANDVYETDTGVLIPAVGAFILEIDLGGARSPCGTRRGCLDEA